VTIRSPLFGDAGPVPSRCANRGVPGGMNISFPLEWGETPAGTKSFVLSVVDPHPVTRNWVHWLVINIPPSVSSLPEGASGKGMPRGSKELQNSFGNMGFGGPQPPRGSGSHPYVITIYALGVESLDLPANTSLSSFQTAVESKAIDSASLTGTFEQ